MKRLRQGFSLVEILLAMTILAVTGGAVIAATLTARRVAEDNLYQATAFTVASGYLEQMVGFSYATLQNVMKNPESPIPTKIDQGDDDPLYLDQETTIAVPIFTSVDPETGEEKVEMAMELKVTPRLLNLRPGSGVHAIGIEVEYEWKNPSTGREYTRMVKTIRADVR